MRLQVTYCELIQFLDKNKKTGVDITGAANNRGSTVCPLLFS